MLNLPINFSSFRSPAITKCMLAGGVPSSSFCSIYCCSCSCCCGGGGGNGGRSSGIQG